MSLREAQNDHSELRALDAPFLFPPQRRRSSPLWSSGDHLRTGSAPNLWPSLTFLFGCLLSFSNHVGGLKRKGAPNRKEPQKRQKVNEPEVLSEDLLVAMALSRSEMEQGVVPAMLPLGTAFPERTKLSAGMCDHEWWLPGEPCHPASGCSLPLGSGCVDDCY